MMNSINGLDGTQELLIKLLEQNPDDWGMRKKVVWFLYEAGYFREASKVVWNAPEIPSVDKEIVFAARIVAKGQPTRAMRLLNAVVERNRAEPEKNLAMAKELVKGGMPLQAARFYGAATLSDSSLIDENFEVSLITTDSEEEDWNEVVQSEEFPWDSPVELTEADFIIDGDDDSDKLNDDMLKGLTQPVPLKAPVQSMKDTVKEEEKAGDLRVPTEVKPLQPDRISTEAVTLSVKQLEEDDDEVTNEAEDDSNEDADEVIVSVDEEELDDEVSNDSDDEDEFATIEQLKDHTSVVSEVADLDEDDEEDTGDTVSDEDDSTDIESDLDDDIDSEDDSDEIESSEEEEFQDEVEEPVAAKKGVFSSLMGLFRRSKKEEVKSDAEILSEPEAPESKTSAVSAIQSPSKPVAQSPIASPIVGPVKPKPVPAPVELQGPNGGRQLGQPEALDCRTRLVALAPEDGSEFFTELSAKYATVSGSKMPEVVTLARDEADLDYIDLINKACSNDKSVNLDSFSTLLGLYAVMTEAECSDWGEDMNLLRKGFGDAVLATVVSKYSVTECRDILGAVYRRNATQAAI